MMRLASRLMLVSLISLLPGVASALPATVTFESATTFDARFPSTQTFTPPLPFSGTGDVDETAGTYTISLPEFTIVLDIVAIRGDDASVVTTGWGQTGSWTPGPGEVPITSSSATGTVACTSLGGLGDLVCDSVPDSIAPWPPTGASGPTLGETGAWIDTTDGPGYDGTIIVNEKFDSSGGQLQNVYRYSLAPEPTATPTITDAVPPFSTPTNTPLSVGCGGDCNGDGMVAISELIAAVNIALGSAAYDTCANADADRSGAVAINDLVTAVNAALSGCVS
jgi:hypothetical protein